MSWNHKKSQHKGCTDHASQATNLTAAVAHAVSAVRSALHLASISNPLFCREQNQMGAGSDTEKALPTGDMKVTLFALEQAAAEGTHRHAGEEDLQLLGAIAGALLSPGP